MNDEILSQLERLAKLKEGGIITDAEFNQQKTAILSGGNTSNSPHTNPRQAKTTKNVGNKSNPIQYVMLGLIFLGIIWIANKVADSKAEEANSLGSTVDTTVAFTDPLVTITNSNWSYYNGEDKMGAKEHTASTEAVERLQFKFPYNGGSVATITLRKNKGTTDISLQVSKGQFIVHPGQENNARVKFDKGSPSNFALVNAADYSSDVVFFSNGARLLAKMKKAKKMIVEIEFYQEGSRQLEFNIDGLKWNY